MLLEMDPTADRTGVVFRVRSRVPSAGGNNAIRREHDRKLGQGTMSRAGAWCPCCGRPGSVAMEMEDIRQEGLGGRLGATMTAVVVDGPGGKQYRLPTDEELLAADVSETELQDAFRDVPFGKPDESMPSKEALGIRVPLYGLTKWRDLFTSRQLLALSALVRATRAARTQLRSQTPAMEEATSAYLALVIDKTADYGSGMCSWIMGLEAIRSTFARFALPIVWDFCETNPLAATAGSYEGALNWVTLALAHFLRAGAAAEPSVLNRSAIARPESGAYDVIVTDPPYYDAIPYSDLMDFFYIWLRRSVGDLPSIAGAFQQPLAPKWDDEAGDGELIDDASRHGNDAEKSKRAYEDGMARAFASCATALAPEGRFVIVFANKQPDAWETLVSAIVRAGFVVDGSWPIRTERSARVRSLSSAALSSSVWLVCKKRTGTARPGWDRDVLQEMRSRIHEQLRTFWDAGIRGPDFVWAATGPALAAYSKHPVVKKADRPNELMTVAEFLRAVRRIVVDFVVGRVLPVDGVEATATTTDGTNGESGLDDVTTYYLLHRHDFGMDDAPAGACILYAVSCNLSESDLADRFDVLARAGGGDSSGDDDEESGDPDAEVEDASEAGTGSAFRLKTWRQRLRPGLGVDPTAEAARARRIEEATRPSLFEAADPTPVVASRPIPLVDKAHRLMHLWEGGDLAKVSAYIEDHLLRRNTLFHKLLQALIELSPEGSDERRVLEVVMNHFRDLGVALPRTPVLPGMEGVTSGEAAPVE